jgi:hypothetical protein
MPVQFPLILLSVVTELLQQLVSLVAAHILLRFNPGIANTWDLVKHQYDRPRLRQFVEDYVRGCAKCQETKPMTSLPKAPLI